ncbi:MAG TPA: hypothetical protein VM077_02895 [Candidatus Limnocylindrales bacterium]|nr:hypothetical protein [Candidatus Limnocylindrales bacterium]
MKEAQGPVSNGPENRLAPERLVTESKRLALKLRTGLGSIVDTSNSTGVELSITKNGIVYRCRASWNYPSDSSTQDASLSKEGISPHFSREGRFISADNYGHILANGIGNDTDGTEPPDFQTETQVASDTTDRLITEFLDAFKPPETA